jgi:GxxExxY protein
MTENEIGTIVIESAIAVHRELGPGLLESVYEVVLAHELQERGLQVERQVPMPIEYKGVRFEEGFRADIIAAGKVILELKSVERVTPAHKKQVQTYLRLTGCKLGYLLNFGEALMKQGITRCVNGLEEPPRLCASAGEENDSRGGAETRRRVPLCASASLREKRQESAL